MNRLPLSELGARERHDQPGVIDFGVLLPGITPDLGSLSVRIIHERDQFIQAVPPVDVPLVHIQRQDLGDYWSGSIDTNDPARKPPPAIGWGTQGGEQRYVYRYLLKRPGLPDLDDIIDPFAREFGAGDLSAITVGYQPFQFDPDVEGGFHVPRIQDAVVYELNIAELGGDLPGTTGLLDYLADLGVNVIEVMPVVNTAARIDWGYDPLGYFGVASRFGKRRDFQQFVAEAHRRGLAVILDSVYGHVEGRFPYALVYRTTGLPNPFIGAYAEDQFFESTDFSKSLTQDFYFTANVFWLETFHIDGFRYDDVPEYWDPARPAGQQGFSDLARATFDHVAARPGAADYDRFFSAGTEMTLIQVAEYLGAGGNPPQHVLYDTVSNSTWQNQTMEAAKRCGRGEPGALADFGLCLGLQGYPVSLPQDGTTIPKSALQYLETHDHERFVCTFGTHFPDRNSPDPLLLVGDRDTRWFKVQPYLIGLFTGKGSPMLWQGQEVCQDYFVPENGPGRVAIYRPVDFNFFYDGIGRALIRLVRKLARIRASAQQFRSGDHFFHGDPEFVNEGLLLFERTLGNTFSLVALNVTDSDRTAAFRFPQDGDYMEEIEGQQTLRNVQAGMPTSFTVPSNYGCIWTIR